MVDLTHVLLPHVQCDCNLINAELEVFKYNWWTELFWSYYDINTQKHTYFKILSGVTS